MELMQQQCILDLASSDLFPLPELVYDRNGVRDVIGGGPYILQTEFNGTGCPPGTLHSKWNC